MKVNDKTTMKQKHHAKNVVSIVIQRSILGINNSDYSVVYYSHGLSVCVRTCEYVCMRACVCTLLTSNIYLLGNGPFVPSFLKNPSKCC